MKTDFDLTLQNVWQKFLEIIFPEECLSCKQIGKTLCDICLEKISKDKPREIGLNWVMAPLNYQNLILRHSLFALKYHHNQSVVKYLVKMIIKNFLKFLQENIIEHNFQNLDNLLIIPIPISKQRHRERGYNQSEIIVQEILKQILEKYNLDFRNNLQNDLLIKNKHTIKFAETHSHNEREELIKDVFSINQNLFAQKILIPNQALEKYSALEIMQKDLQEFLVNKKIILVDDIVTSGATFYEARRILIQHGAQKENIFAFAVAH